MSFSGIVTKSLNAAFSVFTCGSKLNFKMLNL